MDYKEKLKEALNSDNTDYEVVRWIEQNFPELKESEDERIRKGIIRCVKGNMPDNDFRKKYLAWLEKQGEHKKFRDSIQVGDKVTRNEDGVLVNLSQLSRVAKKEEKQGEQKPVDYKNANIQQKDFVPKENTPRYSIGDVLCDKSCNMLNKESQHNFKITDIKNGMYICGKWSIPISQQDEYELVAKMIEQKSVDIVEPKFKIGDTVKSTFSDISYYITGVSNDYYMTDTGCIIMFNAQDNFELSKQKPAWSEEDNIILSRIIADYERSNEEWFNAQKSSPHGRKITWLKSLKDRVQPQNTWKPSDEQMKSLRWVIEYGNTTQTETLKGIYEQLKKLRNE